MVYELVFYGVLGLSVGVVAGLYYNDWRDGQ